MYRKKCFSTIQDQSNMTFILHKCKSLSLVMLMYLPPTIHAYSCFPHLDIDHNIFLLSWAYHRPCLWFVPLRLIVRSGNSSLSPPLFDSDLDDVPERGLLSESSTLYLELTADSSSIPLLLALRYEGEQRDSGYWACILSTFSKTQRQ